MSLRSVKSPISGVVVQRYKSAGEFANEEPLLRIAELDPLRVEVIVPAQLHVSIENGMRAEVSLESPYQGIFPALVASVDRVVDAASGTFDVRLRLDNPDYRIPPGLRCEVVFVPDGPLPTAALADIVGPVEPLPDDPVAEPPSNVVAAKSVVDAEPLEEKRGICRSVGPIGDPDENGGPDHRSNE